MLTSHAFTSRLQSIDNTLLQRLRKSYGLGGKVIDWFTSYLRLSATESSKFARRHPVRCHRQFFLECHKARSLYRSCFSFTLPTCCSSLIVIISRLMRMQTTPRFTVTVSRLTPAVLYSRCLSALTRFRRG